MERRDRCLERGPLCDLVAAYSHVGLVGNQPCPGHRGLCALSCVRCLPV